MFGRRVGMHHEIHVIDVDTAGRDIGGHKRRDAPGVEGLHVAGTGVLGEVSVQVDRGNALVDEDLGQLLRTMLGAGEEDGLTRGRCETGDDAVLLPRRELDQVVIHRRDRRFGRIGLMDDGLVQVALDEHVDVPVERRGEQHPLPSGRNLVEDALDHGKEAHVGHVVGLVEDRDLDGRQIDRPLPHQVEQTPGAGHKHVNALGEGTHLRILVDAPENREALEPPSRRERLEGLLDLRGQLPRRGKDERSGLLGRASTTPLGESSDHRQQKRVRLARAGTAAAEHIATRERIGQRGLLDRGRGGDAALGERSGELLGNTQRNKIRQEKTKLWVSCTARST